MKCGPLGVGACATRAAQLARVQGFEKERWGLERCLLLAVGETFPDISLGLSLFPSPRDYF